MAKMEQTGYKMIQNEIEVFLAEFGFKKNKSSILYRTTENDLLQFLNFQKGAGWLSDQMTINVVQKGLFVPGCSFDTLQPGCRIGQFAKPEKDRWWHCDTACAKQGAGEIKEILFKSVLQFFGKFADQQEMAASVAADEYSYIWWNPATFVDKGYFYLKAGLFNEALQLWESHQPSKVAKYKTIKRLIEENNHLDIHNILRENIRVTTAKLEI